MQRSAVCYCTEAVAAVLACNAPVRDASVRDARVRVGWYNPGFILTPMTMEENRRIRERPGEQRWRSIRRIIDAMADPPRLAGGSLADAMLAGRRRIDRLAPARCVDRLLASFVTRPDPLGPRGP
ncbi:MAG: hypothetical protein U1F11_01340 [Steroidobacteraceae bacterium]